MKNKFNLLLAFVLCVGINYAQKKPLNTPPAVIVNDAPAEKEVVTNYESVPNDPLKTRIYTLSNGMKVYMSVYKNAPRIQTMIAVKAGSKNDPANATGLAHYLEHMLFKGTDKFGTKDFAKEGALIKQVEDLYEVYRVTKDEKKRKEIYHQIDSISGLAAKYAIANEYDKMVAGIGAQNTNAFTSFDETVYINDIPNNQIENWLKIEAERFRKPVLRLFHTELEAVYEEKNRGLDNDNDKAWEAMMSSLFQKHTYGTQTPIGTIDHLKNPSMKEIMKYYNKNYVPNNMAIIMSGDFDPDQTIKDIEKHFNVFASKPVEPYKYVKEAPITSKIVKEVYGPEAENLAMAWRFDGAGTRDADMITIVNSILSNGKAGLFDLNLNQAQKVIGSGGFPYILKDYATHILYGNPKEGQSLEEVERLILEQLEKLKKGEFSDWLLKAIITDYKLQKTKELENNMSRSFTMLNAFKNNIKWQQAVNTTERLSKITKQEVMDFVKKNYNTNNYVVVFKRKGEDKNVEKVEKPAITPVEVDRDNSSPFVNSILTSPTKPIEPRYIDYDKDIQKTKLNSGIPVFYNKNTENLTFEMYYAFDMGSNHDKNLRITVESVPFCGTKDLTAAQVKEELYKLGCSFDIYVSEDQMWVSLNGLSENFEKAVKLFEDVLMNPVLKQESLDNLVSDIIKKREDAKSNKMVILREGLYNYAVNGPINRFTYKLSPDEMRKVTVDQVTDNIKNLTSFSHRVLYYGPDEMQSVSNKLNSLHKVPATLKPIPSEVVFKEEELGNKVYFVDFDMKQAEIVMISKGENYDASKLPQITLYNNYFGGGMSSVVFQDLRESKALTYSAYSTYLKPNTPKRRYVNYSYIGSQADKLAEALKGMSDLLNEMPKADVSFNSAKEVVLQEIRSERITKSGILFNYEEAVKFGNKTDVRKEIFEKVSTMSFDEMAKFQETIIKNKPVTVLVVGKKDKIDFQTLSKYGEVKELTLKDIFGY